METKVRCPKCGAGFGFQKPPAEIVPASPEVSAEQWETECERLCQMLTLLVWHNRMTTAPIAVAEATSNLTADTGAIARGELARSPLRRHPLLPYSPEEMALIGDLLDSVSHLPPERLALLKASIKGVLRGWNMGTRTGGSPCNDP
ncbi:hypothetical protein R5W24_000560 [Gemmata sp. JC717]|uniref:hypothetical protein n=1 Tax=Gemmata algarum TaxID=2975278 RepID=UPI0021BBB039|nr:hypothetical protein [Gemmata algarum]MDY3551484.1 hypothetical protein [Gemmata algarum]